MTAGRNAPLYRVGQVVRILHSWAKDFPPRPVLDVMWDGPWGCYTYAFPRSLIRIKEHMLASTDQPDMDPGLWEPEVSAPATGESEGGEP